MVSASGGFSRAIHSRTNIPRSAPLEPLPQFRDDAGRCVDLPNRLHASRVQGKSRRISVLRGRHSAPLSENRGPRHLCGLEDDGMKKVALLGATGFVGSALLKEALDRGHVVTAIVPNPEKIEARDGLTAKAGDVYDTSSLATLIRGNEAIISAFNPGWKNPNLYGNQVRGTASIIAARRA